MKTNLPEVVLAISLVSTAFCVGCGTDKVNAQEVQTAKDSKPVPIEAEVSPTTAEATPPVPPPGSIIITTKEGAPVPAGLTTAPAATADTNAAPKVVPPAELNLSPALTEVIKLIQAGVGEDVLMAYITNSSEIFAIGSSEILYLHDLGVSGPVITTLIQQDSTPEATARKQAASAAKPLPPGVALTKPATNIYPPATTSQPPGMETVAATNAPPTAPDGQTPAVVYTVPAVSEPVDVNYFYTELAPYGSWLDLPGYGRCWRPTIAVWNSSWRPYADGGRWLWTDRGWYWYSDYSWGWAPFHYGRWTTHHGVGWVWVPDTHWGPSWVSWRNTRTHCGWAPLPPSARWIAGRGFYHNTLSVGVSFDFGLSDHDYVFLPTGRFCDRRPSNYYVAPHHARTLHRESVVVNNYETVNNTTVVNKGMGFDRIAAVNRASIRQVSVRPAAEAPRGTLRRELLDNDGRTLTVARPSPPSATTTGIKPPARPVSSLSHLNPQTGRTGSQPSAPLGNTRNAQTTPAPADSTSPRGSIVIRGNGRNNNRDAQVAIANPQAPTIGPASGAISVRPSRREPSPAIVGDSTRGNGQIAPAPIVRTTPPASVRPANNPMPAPAVRAQAPVVRAEPARVVPPVSVRNNVPSAPAVAPRVAPSVPNYNPTPRAQPAPAPRAERSAVSPSRPAPSAPTPAPSRPSGGSSRSSGSDRNSR